MMEAINTITELCASSLRVGQLTLWTSSLYDSLTFSTKAISVDFFNYLFKRNQTRLQQVPKSNRKLCFFLRLAPASLPRVKLAPTGGEGVTLRFARKAGIEPTLTVLETALLPLEDFRKMSGLEAPHFPGILASANCESKLSFA